MLQLPNARVIVDNGVLRTAADAGLSRIWVEIYSGEKMAEGWKSLKGVSECQRVREEAGMEM